MKVTYTARKVNLRENFKERVEKKLSKFDKIFSDEASAHVIVTLGKNRQKVEITIKDGPMIYRAENTQSEMNDALDKVIDIIGGQLRKNKTKLSKKVRSGKIDELFIEYPELIAEEEIPYNIVRRKQIPVKPISVEEAILQMNMVNHKFYMFTNADTDEVNVVYLRDDGAYGLLEPTYE